MKAQRCPSPPYALCELANRKVKVIFCDHERNPQTELMPIHGSHDTSAKIRQQLRWTENSKQNVWTELVREKIWQQRQLLTQLGLPQADLLERYLEELQLNDTTNREGHAAKVISMHFLERIFPVQTTVQSMPR